MSVNSSSPNASLPSDPPHQDLFFIYLSRCFKSTLGRYIFDTFTISSIVLLLPIYIFILRLGFKQWRQQNFSTTTMSHFDLFTYHMVLVELLNVAGCLCVTCGIHTTHEILIWIGIFLYYGSVTGQLLFHTLTCAERYLAVVHPITYRSLRGERWIKVRNAVIGFIWLLFTLATTSIFHGPVADGYAFVFALTAPELSLISVFSASVLRVLMRSGPGDGNEGRHKVDPSKLRTFYVLVGILVVLVIRLTWTVVSGSFEIHLKPTESENCGLLALTCWVGLPTSLLMPLLYLQRKGKLVFCKKKNESTNSDV